MEPVSWSTSSTNLQIQAAVQPTKDSPYLEPPSQDVERLNTHRVSFTERTPERSVSNERLFLAAATFEFPALCVASLYLFM